MNIRNNDLIGLGSFLMELKLKGKKSRMRTRFVKRLQEQLNLIQEEKDGIIKTYGILDHDGNVKTKVVNGTEVYDIENREQCEKEILELYNETLVIEENEENREMLITVGEAILNCDKEFQGQDALDYDLYCEMFENLTYNEKLAQ